MLECLQGFMTLNNFKLIQHCMCLQDRTAKSKRATRSLDIASQLDKFEEEILEISKILAAEHNKDKDGMYITSILMFSCPLCLFQWTLKPICIIVQRLCRR